MGKVFIGTSGWQYFHWKGIFYPQDLRQKDWLGYYARDFDTVEVNATFYHQMKPKTFKKWQETVGSDFVFSIKGSRYITHIKRLKDCQEEVERFFEAANFLTRCHLVRGDTSRDSREKNVILWQLPPGMKADKERLKGFLEILPKDWRPDQTGQPCSTWRQAFEFRHESWFNLEVYSILKDNNCALVIADSPYWPNEEVVTADFVYLRLHGRESLYASCYSNEELGKFAKKIKQWLRVGLDVYGYFNNDAEGYAIQNATALKNLIGMKPLRSWKGGVSLRKTVSFLPHSSPPLERRGILRREIKHV